MASVAALACLAALAIWPWLFARRTAVVQLSIDEFQNDLLLPLPYGREDVEAIGQALAGRLSPRLEGRRPKSLEYHTANAIGDQLRSEIGALQLTRRDALVAIVRGQTFVTTDGDGRQHACLLAEDVGLSRASPTNIVACRSLVETLASSLARDTLVVLDMGDLRWDPRLGVIAGVVPAQLDEECRQPVGGRGRCWVLGSHDTHEFSGVSMIDRRGIFLRAVELAMAGRADDRQWGGDGDGEVELHELARFVAAWTNAWSMRESGFRQRPVLWKVGVGRVPLDAVEPGVRLVAATPPREANRTAAAGFMAARGDAATGAGTAAAEGASAAPAAAAPADPPSAPPLVTAAGPKPEPEPGLWELLALADSAGEVHPLDYAPHLWRKTVAFAAAISATPRDDSPLATRFVRLERKLEDDLRSFRRANAQPLYDDGLPLARLAAARERAKAGFASAWQNGDDRVRAALAGRNRAFDLAAAVVEYCGTAAGGQVTGTMARPVGPLLDAIAAVHQELVRLAQVAGPGEPPDELVRRLRTLDEAERRLREEVQAGGERLIDRVERERLTLPTADIRWFMRSRLPTADQRRRLAQAVEDRQRAERPAPPADAAGPVDPAETADAAGPASPPPVRLEIRLPPPPVPEPDGARPRPGRPDADWDEVEARLGLTARLLTVFSSPAEGRAEAFNPLAALTAVREANLQSEPAPRVAAAVRAGQTVAGMLAAIPGRVRRLVDDTAVASAAGGKPAELDGLLRLSDPRDASSMPAEALGWPPSVRVAQPLRLAIRANDEPLAAGESRRVTVALQSGAPFPADGTVTFEFDAERLAVRLVDGPELVSGKPLEVKSFPDRGQLTVLVRARRRLAAGDPKGTAPLVAELADGRRRERGERRFQLPIMERLEVAIRGRSGTVEGDAPGADGWWSLAIDPVAELAGEGGEPAAPATLRLRPFPGQPTGWEVAVANQTGEQRTVQVDLVSVGDGARERLVAPDLGGAWRALSAGVERRLPLPATARIVASSGPVTLAAEPTRTAVFLQPLVPPPAAGEDPKAQDSSPAASAITSSLALLIRDLAAAPPPAADPRPDDKPLVRPAERQRAWMVRLELVPRRPASYLEAKVVWSAEERSLTIDVEPRGKDPSVLPDGPLRISAAPLAEAASSADDPLRLSKREAILSAVSPRGSLRAAWNGDDEQPARIALEVDGYPRAFVLIADCRSVMSGVPQRPQRDWRQLTFLEPDREFAAFKPDDTVKVRLAVDIPEDMLGGEGRPIELRMYEKPAADARPGQPGEPIWSGSTDRQADYVVASPTPPAAFAVRATVGDWAIPVRAPGFSDVDVVLESSLNVRDEPKPVVTRRTVVFDGSPPEVEVPRRVRVEQGQEAVLEVGCDDGVGTRLDGRREGASGAAWVEWRLADGPAGEGEKWQQVKAAARVPLRVPTKDLPVGRHEVQVRVIDKVGRESREKCELDVVEPVTPAADAPAPAAPS
ncbi:MAG: hypothetical protein ACKOCX_00305 [Planctomycetota bacterium]